MCDLCNYNSNNINNAVLTVCNNCYSADNHNMITKTDAMNKYVLKANDLTNVRHLSRNNQYRKTTYLYLIKDIEHIAVQKHGSVEKMTENMNEKVIKAKKKMEDKQKEYQKVLDDQNDRKEKLSKYLIDIGFGSLRQDSKLCWQYIYQGEDSGYTIEGIGNTLLEMKFLHTYTNYAKELKETRQKELDVLHDVKTYYFWTDDDEEDLRQRIKKECLRKYVEKNFKNFDQAIKEIPKTIQGLAHKYYADMIKMNK
ncbi:hypothetical protein Klosneuvirus_3_263 [Klosneuvirus KNV1]|uniref:Uncharacterized protein n=1 Tax=Klosneuvirus KNV1 TaxID=1977640 RepID=A0A1V0SKI2_9VIRU|nr:hypothetical protein Klosneuvirus_3_263 [Klosneuvirus KNV1]